MESNEIRIKTGPAGGTGSVMLLVLLNWLGIVAIILLAVVAKNLFPNVDTGGIAAILAMMTTLGTFGSLAVVCLQRVWIEPAGACVTIGKKPRWGIAVSQVQFVAFVSSDTLSAICLSAKTIDELAAMRERQLLKNVFSKDEVALRKRKVGWREAFAKECLLHELQWGLWTAFRKNGLIMLAGNTTLLACIRAMYPHLPYYNMTNAKQYLGSNMPTRVPSPMGLDHYARIQPNGIYIDHFKKEVGFLPGNHIKTIVQMDYFCNRTNAYPSRTPAFMACSQTVEELAAAVPSILYGAETARLDMDEETLATICCLETFRHWNGKDLRMCPLQDTPAIRQQLQEYYPHAQWVDLSDRWMKNSDISGG